MGDWPNIFFEQMIRRSAILNYLMGSVIDDQDHDGRS